MLAAMYHVSAVSNNFGWTSSESYTAIGIPRRVDRSDRRPRQWSEAASFGRIVPAASLSRMNRAAKAARIASTTAVPNAR
jgi:hypothetical protein